MDKYSAVPPNLKIVKLSFTCLPYNVGKSDLSYYFQINNKKVITIIYFTTRITPTSSSL